MCGHVKTRIWCAHLDHEAVDKGEHWRNASCTEGGEAADRDVRPLGCLKLQQAQEDGLVSSFLLSYRKPLQEYRVESTNIV